VQEHPGGYDIIVTSAGKPVRIVAAAVVEAHEGGLQQYHLA
jgi:hypothetical protein